MCRTMQHNGAGEAPRLTRSGARLLYEETGQDLVEYALLAAFIGVVGILLWENIRTGIGTAYANWDTGTQDLWQPPDPGAP